MVSDAMPLANAYICLARLFSQTSSWVERPVIFDGSEITWFQVVVKSQFILISGTEINFVLNVLVYSTASWSAVMLKCVSSCRILLFVDHVKLSHRLCCILLHVTLIMLCYYIVYFISYRLTDFSWVKVKMCIA